MRIKNLEWAILHFGYGYPIVKVARFARIGQPKMGRILTAALKDKGLMKIVADIRRGLMLQKRGNYTEKIIRW